MKCGVKGPPEEDPPGRFVDSFDSPSSFLAHRISISWSKAVFLRRLPYDTYFP